MKKLTHARLRELLIYSPKTGVFRWRVYRAANARAGDVAGTASSGYRQIRVDGVYYLAHQLAWLYMTGEWTPEVDHENLRKDDNRWRNIRPATRGQNAANTRARADNRSGLKGVSRTMRGRPWMARIRVSGRQKYLGSFRTPEAAHAAYVKAARELFGEFARAA